VSSGSSSNSSRTDSYRHSMAYDRTAIDVANPDAAVSNSNAAVANSNAAVSKSSASASTSKC
jgi:hypothetical protein